MLSTITILAAMSATSGLMGHGHCGGGRMHLGHHKMAYASAPAPTCGASMAPMMMMAAQPAMTAPSSQAPTMSRPMASPSAPVVTEPVDTVPPAPVAPAAPAPPAPAPAS